MTSPMEKFTLMTANMINSCFLPVLVEFINKRTSEEPLTIEECIKVLESEVEQSKMVTAQQVTSINPPIGKAKTGPSRFATATPIEGKQCIHKYAKPKALVGMCCGVDKLVPASNGRYCKKHYDQFIKNESKKSETPLSKPGPSDKGKSIIKEELDCITPSIGDKMMIKPESTISDLKIFDSSRNLFIHSVHKFVIRRDDTKLFVVGVDSNDTIRKLIPEERETANSLDYMIDDENEIEGISSNNFADLPVPPVQVTGVPALEIDEVSVPVQITLE